MIDYEFYFDQYRPVPRNSATTNRDLLDFQSTVTYSSYSSWNRTSRRPLTTKYIDGSTFFGGDEQQANIKGLFPRSKGRRKSSANIQKRSSHIDPFMSLVPSEKIQKDNGSSIRSEKNRSPLSMTKSTQSSAHRRQSKSDRLSSAQSSIFNQQQSAQVIARPPLATGNSGWIRRFKSMNESQVLTEFLRENSFENHAFLKKRSNASLHILSSASSASSVNRSQRANC